MHTASAVDWNALLVHPEVLRLVDLALDEDVTPGDVTTAAIFRAPQRVRGHIVSREATVVCGVPLARLLLQRFDGDARVEAHLPEGSGTAAAARILSFDADVRAVLGAERTVLNFMMRLSGIAAAARAATGLIPAGARAKIYDTRKTVPGWRRLDKAAVATGGACNHRMGLYDAVLIKDNHVAAAGSVSAAVRAARAHVGKTLVVEVEVDTLNQLDEALEAAPDVILLDNFPLEALREAVARVDGRVILEASGGITAGTLAEVASAGVDRISMGSLTHSVRPADLSLEITS
jgi:nicotinate-nucleotide pyrophosphorylase (carboxylating)